MLICPSRLQLLLFHPVNYVSGKADGQVEEGRQKEEKRRDAQKQTEMPHGEQMAG